MRASTQRAPASPKFLVDCRNPRRSRSGLPRSPNSSRHSAAWPDFAPLPSGRDSAARTRKNWPKGNLVAARREIKVGAFVLAGLIAIGGVIFMIGEERQLFKSKLEYQVSFTDVQGLRPGSPVRMGGVDIGTVSKVGYAPDENDRKIHVTVAIISAQARRIKTDSLATIEGKGLLGDNMVSISTGSPRAAALPPGSNLKAQDAEDMGQLMTKLGTITMKVEKVAENLQQTT